MLLKAVLAVAVGFLSVALAAQIAANRIRDILISHVTM